MRNIHPRYSYPVLPPHDKYVNKYPSHTIQKLPDDDIITMKNLNYDKITLKDYGKQPFVVNIEEITEKNKNFRTALWTGDYLQLTLMSIPVGGEIGLEVHPNTDQFIRIEEGQGLVKMGDSKDAMDFQEKVHKDFAVIIPAGKWHNLINTGKKPIKLYSIYAPPKHPFGTVHATKKDAELHENHH